MVRNLPPVTDQVSRTYVYMMEHSSMLISGTEEITVWEGTASEIAKHVNASQASVYRYVSVLTTMQCVKQLRHGSGNSPGIYQLLREPETNEYHEMQNRSLMTGRSEVMTKSVRLLDTVNRLASRVDSLEKRVKELEDGNNLRRASPLSEV